MENVNSAAEVLWQESEKYLAFAAEHLEGEFPNSDPCPDNHEWLRISFLFPSLPEKSKTDLLLVRRFYLIAREQQERERLNPHETAEYAEAMADEVAGELKQALPLFSEVQQEILKKHYLILSDS